MPIHIPDVFIRVDLTWPEFKAKVTEKALEWDSADNGTHIQCWAVGRDGVTVYTAGTFPEGKEVPRDLDETIARAEARDYEATKASAVEATLAEVK